MAEAPALVLRAYYAYQVVNPDVQVKVQAVKRFIIGFAWLISVAGFGALTCAAQSGEGRRYSSIGYHLLGRVIEKVSGKSWGQFLHERIFTPLGMARTRVYSTLDIIPNRASGYINVGGLKNGLWMTPAIMGHGGDPVTGFTSNFSRFTDDKLAVIVLTNLMPLDIGGITRRVAGFYVPTLIPAIAI
jgi:CubicO group peptidase (beta-lactamase class C family)